MSDLKTTKEIRRQMIDKGMVTASFDVVESVLTILDANAASMETIEKSLAGLMKVETLPEAIARAGCPPEGFVGTETPVPVGKVRRMDSAARWMTKEETLNSGLDDEYTKKLAWLCLHCRGVNSNERDVCWSCDNTPRPEPPRRDCISGPGLDEQVADARERHDERESKRIGPVREYTAETDSEGLVTKLTRVRDGLPDVWEVRKADKAWMDDYNSLCGAWIGSKLEEMTVHVLRGVVENDPYAADLCRLLGERDAEIATRQEREERLCRDKGRILGYERKAQEQVRVRDANLKRICTDRYNLGEALTTERAKVADRDETIATGERQLALAEKTFDQVRIDLTTERKSHVVTEEQREAALGDYNTELAKVAKLEERVATVIREQDRLRGLNRELDSDRGVQRKRADDAEAKLEADTRKWLIQGADLSMARAAETTRAEKLKVELAEARAWIDKMRDYLPTASEVIDAEMDPASEDPTPTTPDKEQP